MADLDDFFKKRDKKKKPTTAKSKFSVLDTEEFAKQLEATTAAAELENVESELNANVDGGSSSAVEYQPQQTQSASAAAIGENADEEWKPFDSEDNKDYSGLRIDINNWKIEDEEGKSQFAAEENDKKSAWGAPKSVWGPKKTQTEEDEEKDEEKSPDTSKVEGEEETTKESSSSEPAPAHKAEEFSEKAAAPTAGSYVPPYLRNKTAAAAPTPAAPVPAAPAKSVYVPPHLRDSADQSSSSSSSGPAPVRKSNKAQPNIMDTMEFPSLDTAVVAESSDKVNGGER
jgi:hypothetical protein